MPEQKKNAATQRKRKFVNHPIQWELLRVVTFSALVPTIFLTASLYFLIWQTIASEVAVPELMSQILRTAWYKINFIILISTPFIIIIFFYWALLISHRVAGPIARIDKQLDEMIESCRFSQTIKIRETDSLYTLISKFDRLIKLIQDRQKK